MHNTGLGHRSRNPVVSTDCPVFLFLRRAKGDMAVNKIIQIPTEKNVNHLFNNFANALCQRDVGLPVSAREIQIRKEEYQKLLKQATYLKGHRDNNG